MAGGSRDGERKIVGRQDNQKGYHYEEDHYERNSRYQELQRHHQFHF